MAIAPNTTFVSGAVLTAAQQNAFGFGTIAYAALTTGSSGITTIATQITLPAFTAIANRNYKITYAEPNMFCIGASGEATLTIMVGATTYNSAIQSTQSGLSCSAMVTAVTTFTAGSTIVLAKLTNFNSTSLTASRTATKYAYCLVEDIGPA